MSAFFDIKNIQSLSEKDFLTSLDNIFIQLKQYKPIIRLLFFVNIENNSEYRQKHDLITKKTKQFFGSEVPLVGVIAQKPLESNLSVEVHILKNNERKIHYKTWENTNYITVENHKIKDLFVLAPTTEALDFSIKRQSDEAFKTVRSILEYEQIPISGIVRQWNYIEKITETDTNGQRYQQFNDARTEFYNSTSWENGYPAATGIGTTCGGILVDINAVKGVPVVAINNKLQVAAHHYSEKVLEKGLSCKRSSPKFERAKKVSEKLLYVSGTAAIRGEQTIAENILEQTTITVENIFELLKVSKMKIQTLKFIRIYIKKEKDFEKTKQLIDIQLKNIPALFVEADICRENLLVEIEAYADI